VEGESLDLGKGTRRSALALAANQILEGFRKSEEGSRGDEERGEILMGEGLNNDLARGRLMVGNNYVKATKDFFRDEENKRVGELIVETDLTVKTEN